jgi:hypothetical protein
MRVAPHLHDQTLLDCYLAQRQGDAMDPPFAEHLAECPACATRYADLTSMLEGARTEGIAGADAVFTPDRLRAQQLSIAKRLEAVGRPARVITFPGRVVRQTMSAATTSRHLMPRWTAAAMAAALVVGIALGAGYEYGARGRQAPGILVPGVARGSLATGARGAAQPEATTDDAVLTDLELALERPRYRELRAYDAFTPHVREINNPR